MDETTREQLGSGITVICTGASVAVPRGRTRGASAEESDSFVEAISAVGDDVLAIVEEFDVDAGPTVRGAPGVPPSIEVEVPAGPGINLALVRDETTGLWRWELPADASLTRTREAPQPTRFSVQLGGATTTRGVVGALAGKLAKFVIVRFGDELIAKGANKLAEVFEQRRRRGGLRWFGPDDYRIAKPAEADQLRGPDVARLGERPSLLFVHGTMSLTHSGFRRLPTDLVGRLGSAYDGRVWAYDHHTLSKSPDQNAKELVAKLRELGAPRLVIDVIAHSRGGLVARELAALRADDSPVEIRSLTFVGTPNTGTPLCDPKHLQRLVDRFTNLLAFVPDNPITDVVDAVGTVAATLALRALDGLVGLSAMDPAGSYLGELNDRRPRKSVECRAITSNFDPTADTDIARRLRDLAIDGIFGDANDLIVPTASAYGPVDQPLVAPAQRFEFQRDQGVDHSSFWDRPEFAEHVERLLQLPSPISVRTAPRPVVAQPTGADAEPDRADAAPEDEDLDAQTVTVTAIHGSLEHAAHPLMIGHYRGVALDGAGLFLDARLGRRLSTRLMLGQFPEQVGESIIVDSPARDDGRAYPPGALVVGLGSPGEITREQLTATAAAAMLRFAIEIFEGQRAPEDVHERPARLRFSAVPIGTTSAGGLSSEACVAALVDAVITVNDQLFRHTDPERGGCWDTVRICALEFIALWEDRAELVAHALRRLPRLLQVDAGVHTQLEVCERLVVREGALRRRPQSEERAGEWQRLIIRDRQRDRQSPLTAGAGESGAITLEFTAVGGRARAERVDVTLDARAVESLIESATREARPGSQENRTLYELLLPTQLKQDLFRFDNLQFIVDENTADFPWEALAAGSGRELGLRSGLLRQFQEFEGIRQDVRSPVGDHVLVIGAPPVPPLASLPGASAEASSVAELLATDFDVQALIWNGEKSVRDDFPGLRGSAGRRILNALFAEEWRIVHVASHGQFNPIDSSRSGVVIDSDVYITPNIVRQLPVVPELVFVNCCYLGQLADSRTGPRDPNRLAASVARELMRIGVRAVVAAGWAVDDEPAGDFACAFYAELLAGRLLGEAVHAARRRVHQTHPASMTWGAFQCYGDPSFRLREAGHSDGPVRRSVGERDAVDDEDRLPFVSDEDRLPFVSEAELVRRVQTVHALAGKIGLPTFDELTRAEEELADELRRYLRALTRPEWHDWETAAVLADFGAAFGELGRYVDAVDCYRRAWAEGQCSDVSMHVVEQLGNLEIQLAQNLARGESVEDGIERALGSRPPAVEDLVTTAETRLSLALQVGITCGRLALLGGYHKKMATLTEREKRGPHLEGSCAHYRQAHEQRVADTSIDDGKLRVATLYPYYTQAWLQMSVLARQPINDALAKVLLNAIDIAPRAPKVLLDDKGTVVDVVRPESEDGGERLGDYWERVARANNMLTRAVRNNAVDMDVGALADEYRGAFGTRASRRNRDSTVDHLRDLAVLMESEPLGRLADDLMSTVGASE